MRGWCSLQICISRRLLRLLPLVLYCQNGYEKYWQPNRPRTHANNTSIVKICPEQLVLASFLNTLSSFHYSPKFWSVSVPLEKKKQTTTTTKKQEEVNLGRRFPFVRTGWPAHSHVNDNFTFIQN